MDFITFVCKSFTFSAIFHKFQFFSIGMANALPPQNQQGMYSAPSGQQQYMTGPPHQSQQYQQGGPPPQQAPQQPPPAPTQLEGELISFD